METIRTPYLLRSAQVPVVGGGLPSIRSVRKWGLGDLWANNNREVEEA